MQRSFSAFILAVALSLVIIFAGCGGGSSNNGGGGGGGGDLKVATVQLNPAPQVSVDVAGTAQMFVRILDSTGKQINTLTPTYNTSNASVATVSTNGLLCAGTWDSLTNPVVCTAGPTNTTAVITATAGGVTSNAVTVYVHDHITQITITPADADPCKTANTDPANAAARGENYFAKAVNASNVDITAQVGNFNWSLQSPNVATLLTSASGVGLAANQAQLQANVPGSTNVTATVSGTTGSLTTGGLPPFVTCPPASIFIRASGGATTFTVNVGQSTPLFATVIDTRGFDISSIPLTISSSWPGAIQRGSTSESGGSPGTTGIVFSCTPPACNTNVNKPVYSNVVKGIVAGNPADTTLWIGSTQFPTAPEGSPAAQIIPVNITGAAGSTVAGNAITLPHVPNSMFTNVEGNTLYMGSAKGLMVMDENTNAVNTVTNAPGKILAVSRLGNQVVIADQVGNQVYIFNASSSSVTTLPIPFNAAMSASFSVDDFRGYITSGGTLYIISPTQALITQGAGVTATSTDFLANGSFAYMVGGSIAASESCVPAAAGAPPLNSATAQQVSQVWDGSSIVVMEGSGIDHIATPIVPSGCPPTAPAYANTFDDFGLGPITSRQLLVTPSSAQAYVAPVGINKVLFVNLPTDTVGSITLAAPATEPLAIGTLQSTARVYAITAGDNALHVLDTGTATDLTQIGVSFPACSTCKPDLLAVRPK